MLQAHSKGNGFHKTRVNGEDAPESDGDGGPTRSGERNFPGDDGDPCRANA